MNESLFGKSIGLWTVLDDTVTIQTSKRTHKGALVVCKCGKRSTVRVYDLLNGKTTGCRSCKTSSKTTVESVANEIWLQYHRSAESRGFSMDIEKDDFVRLIQSNCYYCGAPPRNRAKRKIDFFTNGVDRKDNLLGYTKDNCVACCSMCNRGKHTVDYDTWIEHLDKLVAYRSNLKSTK